MKTMVSFFAKTFTYATILLIITSIFVLRFGFSPSERQQPGLVFIEKGMGLRTIANKLEKDGFVKSAFGFVGLTLLKQSKGKIKAGEYEIQPYMSPAEILALLVSGKTYLHKFLVVEGQSLRQVYTELAKDDKLTGEFPQNLPEGVLLPDTYYYSRGDTRQSLLTRMNKAMQKVLNEAWAKRAPDAPVKTPLEVLILASLIEKETRVPAERPHIASVYANRLKAGMPLQMDPTVIYAITKGEMNLGRPLNKSDLSFVSPYNTYLNRGLPPTPICNPGKASIEAALHPIESNDLYFVVDGKGGHHFSPTLKDHNARVSEGKRSGAL